MLHGKHTAQLIEGVLHHTWVFIVFHHVTEQGDLPHKQEQLAECVSSQLLANVLFKSKGRNAGKRLSMKYVISMSECVNNITARLDQLSLHVKFTHRISPAAN